MEYRNQKLGVLVSHDYELSKYGFFCPACREIHEVEFIKKDEDLLWNGDLEKPYFNSSVTRRVFRRSDDGRFGLINCHFSLVNGYIVYFMDSGHHLAGTMQEIPKWTEQ